MFKKVVILLDISLFITSGKEEYFSYAISKNKCSVIKYYLETDILRKFRLQIFKFTDTYFYMETKCSYVLGKFIVNSYLESEITLLLKNFYFVFVNRRKVFKKRRNFYRKFLTVQIGVFLFSFFFYFHNN